MKKVFLAVLMVLVFSMNVWATSTHSGDTYNDYTTNNHGGDATAIQEQMQNQTQEQFLINKIDIAVMVQDPTPLPQIPKKPDITTQEVNITNIQERELLAAPSVGVPATTFITGEITRYNLLPVFANTALRAYANEPVVEVVYDSYGNPFSRITPDELPQFLLSKAAKYEGRQDMRCDVICYKASTTLHVGSSGGASGAAENGLVSGTGVGVAGGGWAVAKAYCAVWLYKIKMIPAVVN